MNETANTVWKYNLEDASHFVAAQFQIWKQRLNGNGG